MPPTLLVVVTATLLGALPSPPKQVVLKGRGTFGEIHFDHEAHLARKLSCVSCHGPGPVRKPELTPASAHGSCRACHVEQKRGPTSCRDCHTHVRETGSTLAPATATTTATTTPGATEAATPTPTSADPERSAAAGGAESKGTTTAPTLQLSLDRRSEPPPLLRTIHAGFAMMSSAGRAGAGMGVNVNIEGGPWVATSEVDWTNRPGAQRALALFGGGMGMPLGDRVRARAVALCGVDAGAPAYVLPAVGARIDLELRNRRPGLRLLPSADASVGFVTALGSRSGLDGQPARERALVLSLLLGWELPPL
jgi:hypothetical protein